MQFSNVKKLTLGLLLLIPISLLACAAWIFFGPGLEIHIPKAVVVEVVNREFPTVKNQGLLSVTVANPHLDFEGSRNRLGVQTDATVRLFGAIPIHGHVIADGTLAYQKQSGTFIFTDVQVRNFNFQGLPSSKFDQVSGLVGSALLSTLGGLQVYQLDPHNYAENIAKLGLRGIYVTNDGITAKLGAAFF